MKPHSPLRKIRQNAPRPTFDQVRARLLRFVLAAPGILAERVAERSGYGRMVVDMGLDELTGAELIYPVPSPKGLRYWPGLEIPPTLNDRDLDWIAAVRSDLPPGEMAKFLGCEVGEVYRALCWDARRGPRKKIDRV